MNKLIYFLFILRRDTEDEIEEEDSSSCGICGSWLSTDYCSFCNAMHDEDDSSQTDLTSYPLTSTVTTSSNSYSTSVEGPQSAGGAVNVNNNTIIQAPGASISFQIPEFILRSIVLNVPLTPYEASIASLFFHHQNVLFGITQFQDMVNALRIWASNEENSSSSIGLDTRQLNRLPTFSYKKSKSGKSEDRDIKCTVCYSDFEDSEQLKMLPCFHKFHVGCIDSWLKLHSLCPICKEDLSDYI